ncbi:uncharacterized protein PV06_11328 [Exophiala oligosperma]|uniref:Uncharacterized protein n=1 Tax=Exophiala oligosperma TaxID=215243 RepID=A0A0D2DL46_9EURO|nr:uncharacterized protein PV06_11328 [Exophiala oligosperma]KIW36439.1 hypothetical protein PV06_11328 [Exophiala oligosperma]
MFQQHPLDVNGKLLRRFYEPLTLLRVIDPTRGAQRPDLTLDRGLDEQSKLWRNFLDQLAFLCDFEKGGDTVTAVAVQRTVEYPIFSLASNSKSRNKAAAHLRWILTSLGQIHTTEKTAPQVEDEITNRCIEFSHRRIKVYSAWLVRAIRNATRTTGEVVNAEDAFILKEFQQVTDLESTPHQLCSHAHTLRRGRLMEILTIRHVAHSHRGVWSDIRHYLGRLGSWSKAVRILILGAATFPQRIENARVEIIGTNGPADLPNKHHLTDLNGVVKRMVPADQTAMVKQFNQALLEANSVAQVEDRFREEYAHIKPRPHAELLLLEYFHRNGLDFATDDRYIGCSKPSCYCCHIYMHCHPGRFAPRPCHGNLWIHWAPPYPLPLADRGAPKNVGRPQEHHTFKMLQEMLVSIRRDLQEQILSRRPKRARLPDSTTGMSSVMLDVDALLTAAQNIGQSQDGHDHDDMNDLNEPASAPNDFESEATGDGARQEVISKTEHDLNDKQERTHDMQRNDPEAISEGDDAGILLFRGRKTLIQRQVQM